MDPLILPSITPVNTSLPAFIGYTEKYGDPSSSLKLKPTLIASMEEYYKIFGGPKPETGISVAITEINRTYLFKGKIDPRSRSKFIMYYALQLYYENGGGPCYIVSVNDYESSEGNILMEDLKLGLNVTEQIEEISLYVFPEAQGLDRAEDFYELYACAIDMCAKLQDRFTVMDVWNDPALSTNDWVQNIAVFRKAELPLGAGNLKFAAAYYPNLKTTLNYYYGGEVTGDANVKINHLGRNRSLGGDLSQLKSKNHQLYFRARSAIQDIPIVMPPSPAMAGIYVSLDSSRGVWKAPANVRFNGVIEPVKILTQSDQEVLNVDTASGRSINALRLFPGKGTLAWGARTLAGNDNEWRYIPVVRFFMMVKKSIKIAMEPFGLEPNDRTTWNRVRSMIENFLIMQWRSGALVGPKTDDAFFVQIGLGHSMTSLDIIEGRMTVDIGLAVMRPAEFIILRITQKMFFNPSNDREI